MPKAIRRVASEQLQLAADNTSSKASADSIHCARKAIKRTRAVLKMLRSGNHELAARKEDRTLGDAARLLAAERDIHVQWTALTCLPICGENGVCKVLRQRLQKAEADLQPQKRKQLKQFNAAIKAAQSRLEQWPIDDLDAKLMASALKASYRRTRKRFERVCEVPTAVKLHKWRKAAKTFWYQLQLAEFHVSKKHRKIIRDVEDLTGYLGDDHDLHLLSQELSGAADSKSLEVREVIRKRRNKLQKRALKLASKTFDLAPSKFHKQISHCLNQAKN